MIGKWTISNVRQKEMGKTKRSRLIAFGVVLAILMPFAWYFIADQYAKAGLRHALSLRFLPTSLKIVGSGGESWTDYLYVADIRISPEQFPELLEGRGFEPYRDHRETIEETWIRDFHPLQVTESWSWPPWGSDESFDARCTVHTDQTRSRVFVRYISD